MATVRELLLGRKPAVRATVLRALPGEEAVALDRAFGEWAHDGQLAPSGDWRTWVLMAGRGFGKTRAGAEWVLGAVRGSVGHPPPRPSPRGGGRGEDLRIALVAATVDEARRVMVEGASGVLACAREGRSPSGRGRAGSWCSPRGRWRRCSRGANPEALRGPQHHLAWCDELAKWRHAEAAWDMLALGLRCGARPRALVTTTPRGGCAALKRILAAEGTVLTHGTSRDNPHLPAAFLAAVEAAYGGRGWGARSWAASCSTTSRARCGRWR